MAGQRRVLILTADAGFGHRSAAKALAAALAETRGEACACEVVNVLDHPKTPGWLRDAQSDYDRVAREAADLYKFTYDISDRAPATRMMENAMRALLYRAMRDIVLGFRPDVVVSTYPLYSAPLGAVYLLSRTYVPTICVVTDLATVHRIWFSGDADLTVVPTSIVRDLALGAGLSPDKVEVIGIPVHPSLSLPPPPRPESGRAVCLAVGSKRVGKLPAVLGLLNHSMLPLELDIVAGGDEGLFARLSSQEWHLPTRLHGFVDDMPSLMRRADFVVAKAGGLIVTESLAVGLPLLLIDMIPGQETGNAEYAAKAGAAEIAGEPAAALEIAYHWLDEGGRKLRERAAAARALGRPRAAFEVMDRAWEMAGRGPSKREPIAASVKAKLKELFARYGESWED